MKNELRKQVLKLPTDERLRLASDLWDSVRDEDIRVTPAQKKLLRERLAAYKKNPENTISHTEFTKRLQTLSRTLRTKQRRSA